MMNHPFRVAILTVTCFACVAGQTAPKGRPLTELSDDEKRALYMNGPVGAAPIEEKKFWKKTVVITTTVCVLVPLIVLQSLALSDARK